MVVAARGGVSSDADGKPKGRKPAAPNAWNGSGGGSGIKTTLGRTDGFRRRHSRRTENETIVKGGHVFRNSHLVSVWWFAASGEASRIRESAVVVTQPRLPSATGCG